MNYEVSKAEKHEFDSIWPVFKEVVQAGETHRYPSNISKEMAFTYWMHDDNDVYVLKVKGDVVGTYFLRTAHIGRGAHIANASYMLKKSVRGQGLGEVFARHSLTLAQKKGFVGMQFNLVVSSNTIAIHLWKKLGFSIIGTVPQAFHHARLGHIDAHIMFKCLQIELPS